MKKIEEVETYEEAVDYIMSTPKFTTKNSMENTRCFLGHLGNPCCDRKIIHVAGTNGKGSVCAYLHSILQEAGIASGMFISPHLVTMRERFVVEGQMISEQEFLEMLRRRAIEFKSTPCIGRTHGIHADITSYGLKWALWYEEMKRDIERFKYACQGVEAGKMSGAVGNFANIPPFIQDYVCDKLGINSANISTQVLQRDRHAYYMATLAVIAGTLEQMATEVRNSQRTEVRESEEAFRKGQKGSSAMPHKRNPISSENICGCARVMRGYMVTACENEALWYERDISHSSTERIILPDATELLDYMLCRLKGILENLVVYPEKMLENIYLTKGVIFAQRVMNLLISKGLSREEAYDTVQPVAMKAWTEGLDYKTLLSGNEKVMGLVSPQELDSCFTLDYYFKNVDFIFDRVGI